MLCIYIYNTPLLGVVKNTRILRIYVMLGCYTMKMVRGCMWVINGFEICYIHEQSKRQYLPCSVKQLHCSLPQHNSLPCTSKCTTHPPLPTPLPSTTLLCTQLTNTCIAYLCKWQQNGTRCRDGGKVLWCH